MFALASTTLSSSFLALTLTLNVTQPLSVEKDRLFAQLKKKKKFRENEKKKKKENLNIQRYSQPTRLSFFFRSYPIDIQDTRYRIDSSNTRTHANRDDI